MRDMFTRGLRAIERRDGIARLQFRLDGAATLPDILAATAPGLRSLTLSPSGEVTALIPEAELDATPPGATVLRRLSILRVSGVCMSGAENKARRICGALARQGITMHALSLCDLAFSFAVDEADADRALDLIGEAVPLVR